MRDTSTIHRLFVEADLRSGVAVALSQPQANYLFNVLRLQAGETIAIFNGRDGEWQAELTGAFKRAPALNPQKQSRPQSHNPDIHYYFAPLKSARLDYLMQKGVEMGAARLVPVLTQRTQAHRFNMERAMANMIEAAEQCEILALPELAEPVKFDRMVAQWPSDRIMIFCDEAAPVANPVSALAHLKRGTAAAVIIGPEGGFTDDERRALLALPNVVQLSLGPRILRADTAAVAALSVVQMTIGDIGAP